MTEIFYPSGLDLPAWRSAHAEGLVPDSWPYGLNGIQNWTESRIRAVEAGQLKPHRIPRALATNWLRTRAATDSTVSISWDEQVAIRMAAERPEAQKLTGVIWATDRFLRGEKSVRDMLLRRLLPRFHGLWTLSKPQIEKTDEWLGRDSPPVDFLPFGIDQRFFTPWEYPDRPLILSVGRDRDRDHSTLYAAFEKIKRMRPDVEILVQSHSSLPLPRGVKEIPVLPHAQLRDLYRRAAVVVIATKPNIHVSGMTVALEAMATSRPVVVCNTPGMSDYVEHGVTGLTVSPGAAADMADRVLDLLTDSAAAAAMGERGRARIEACHTTEAMAHTLAKIISKRTA